MRQFGCYSPVAPAINVQSMVEPPIGGTCLLILCNRCTKASCLRNNHEAGRRPCLEM